MIHVPGRLVHGEISDKILKAYYQVYDALPYGLPESAYQRAMQIALTDLGLKFETEKIFAVYFRDQCVGRYRGDLVVEGRVIVENKTATRIVEAHINQLCGYLRISGLQVGLILNFGPEPTFERYFLHSRGERLRLSEEP